MLLGCGKTRKYTGKFEFTVISISWSILPPYSTVTKFTYNGDVKKNSKKHLDINYSNESIVSPEINEDGSFVPVHENHSLLRGNFTSKDEVEFYYSRGGNGGGIIDSVTGKRR